MTAPTQSTQKIVADFFEDYERGANTFDADLVTSAYTKDFVTADPNGAYPMANDAAFRKAVPERKKQFEALGFQSAKILSLTQTSISKDYVQAKAKWRMVFEKKGEPIQAEFLITYIVHVKEGKAQIPFYISHDSEEEMMKDLGIV